MARNSDHGDGFEPDDSGGLLGGLLADEDGLDRRALWRIGSWGVAATGAVVLAVMANQSSLGLKRDQLAAADLTRQAQQIQSVARETQNEARRLAAAIDTLNSDRDRLYARVTGLEQGLESVTGAVARQGSLPASSPATTEPHTVQGPPAPAVAPVGTTHAASAPPVEQGPTVSSVARDAVKIDAAKTEIAKWDAPKGEGAKTELPKTELPKIDSTRTEIAKPDSGKADTAKAGTAKTDTAKTDAAKSETAKPDVAKPPPTGLMAAQATMAPDPAATKLLEPGKPSSSIVVSPIPEVVASAPASDDDESDAPKIALQRTEFGVDVGTANSVNGLRALWRGLLKSRSNAPLATLRPIIVVKEGTNGLGMQLRLVAGPLNDAGAAARICAVLTENKRHCETAIFDGQRLSLGPEDQPAAAAKPTPHRRGVAKRAAAVVVEEPKKPEKPPETPSTGLTSFFNRRNPQ